MSDAERRAGNLKLKVAFVLIVTASAGLIALQGDPTLAQLLAALVAGFAISLLLLWYLVRTLREFMPEGVP